MKSPLVVEIIRGSNLDGPGLRTVIFFKGCPLSCIWCHNPETLSFKEELSYKTEACVRCGECEKVCPTRSISLSRNYIVSTESCKLCFQCVDVCNHKALTKIGELYSIEQLYEIILRDKTYYEVSGGGVTFSGGEPLLHIDFLSPLVKKLHKANIHVAFETSGWFDMKNFQEKIAPYTDLVLYDIKSIDEKKHKEWTGATNTRILDNFKQLLASNANGATLAVQPRIPLVPGFNTDKKSAKQLINFLNSSLNDPEKQGEHNQKKKNIIFLSYNPPSRSKFLARNKKPDSRMEESPLNRQEENMILSYFQ